MPEGSGGSKDRQTQDTSKREETPLCRTGLNSRYSAGMWKFAAKKQGKGQWGRLRVRKILARPAQWHFFSLKEGQVSRHYLEKGRSQRTQLNMEDGRVHP